MQWETKTGGGGWLEPKLFRENVSAPFSIGSEADNVTIPAGDYTFADLQFVLMMGAGRRLRANVDTRAGTYFDGTRAQVILSPTWNVSRHFELGTDYQFTRLRFDDRGQSANIHLARLRLRGALDARASGNAFIQYNSTTHRLGLSFRLRYNFAEGTDLWLLYDEALATERFENDLGVRLPLSASRALVLKYTHTLVL